MKKGKKCSFWHTVTLSFYNDLKEKLHIDEKYLIEQFEIFHKQVIRDSKMFQLQRYSSGTLHVSPKTPISEGSKKVTSTKIQISLFIKSEWFDHKTIEPISFWKSCMPNQL